MKITLGMAFSRSGFKDKLAEFVSGGYGEFLASKIGELAGLSEGDYVGHWRREAERLLEMELPIFFHTTTTKTKFDRFKALQEVLYSLLVTKQKPILSTALTHVKSVLTKKKLPFRVRRGALPPDFWANEVQKSILENIKTKTTLEDLED